MIEWNPLRWNWLRWPWHGVSEDNRISAGVHKRVEKERDERDLRIAELDKLIGRLTRKNEELVDQVKLRDERIASLRESERMLRSRVEAYTALFERKRLDNMAGLPESEE